MSEGFKKVSYKKRAKQSFSGRSSEVHDLTSSSPQFSGEYFIRRLQQAKHDILASNFFTKFKTTLQEAYTLVGHHHSKEFICFGIGLFMNYLIPLYQLALILILNETYKYEIIKIYDPVLKEAEHEMLKEFGFIVLEKNIEAKYKVNDNTIIFLPHCPKQLTNNLLWANWSPEALMKCVLISNSFEHVIESNINQLLINEAEYLLKISPYTTELPLNNSFRYDDIFNDLSIHIFPNIPSTLELWTENSEPKYLNHIGEFIHSDS